MTTERPDDYFEGILPTESDSDQNYAYRERYADGAEDGYAEAAPPSRRKVTDADREDAKTIALEAHDLIVDFEVTSEAVYKRKYERPTWPQGASGVTIGIGYDLGYCSPEEFAADWGPYLQAENVDALKRVLGAKGARAHDLVGSVGSVIVSWAAANKVFDLATLPSYAGQTKQAFPGVEKLHKICYGALISLVYNRGPSTTGNRREGMLEIRRAIGAKDPQRVPKILRDMKGLWPDTPGLQRRREAEARLFEKGLIAQENETRRGPALIPPLVVASAEQSAADAPMQERVGTMAAGTPQHDGDGAGLSDADYTDAPMPEAVPDQGPLESVRPDWAGVHWVEDDTLSTDYRHLLADDRARVKDAGFLFTAEDFETLLKANQFDVVPQSAKEKRVIFGLRGTTLDFDVATPNDKFAQVGRHALRLKTCRPDHQHFRCVIGVYDSVSRTLSGFMASTVPNRGSVEHCKRTGTLGNLLATGFYRYEVGAHSKGRFLGCLRQARPIAVLRTRKNLVYDVADEWDIADDSAKWPMDNIHPAFADNTYHSAEFSSFGCQVVRGTFRDGVYTDQFAGFRSALGLREPGTDNGRLFSYVLLTGDEAAIASMLRSQQRAGNNGAVTASLTRLRQGSGGPTVAALQRTLPLDTTGVFDTATKRALITFQREKLGELAGDGIFSPAIDATLQLAVLAPVAPPSGSAAKTHADGSLAEAVAGGGASGNTYEAILYNIGRRAECAEGNAALLTAPVLPQYESITGDMWKSLVDRGGRILDRTERTLHQVMCGDADGDKIDRDKIRSALATAVGGNRDRVIDLLSTIITSTVAIPAIVSRPIAEVLYDRLAPMLNGTTGGGADAVLGQVCIRWTDRLHDGTFKAALADSRATEAPPQAQARAQPAAETRTDPPAPKPTADASAPPRVAVVRVL